MNKNLFPSQTNSTLTKNDAGGSAYAMNDQRALTQLVVTGGLSSTYYVSAQNNLTKIQELAEKVVKQDPDYLAKLAVYSRKNAFMKDTPAFLLAVLACKAENRDLYKKIFNLVIDDEKMLKNFVQVIRSGKLGRKSFGTSIKKTINKWLNNRNNVNLFKGSIGNDPSLADVMKLTHPKALGQDATKTAEKNAIFRYILGHDLTEEDRNNLPKIVQDFEAWKKNPTNEMPEVPFQMLTASPLTTEQWKEIAKNSSFTTLRMNLNTFERHQVLKDSEMVNYIANRLGNIEEVQRTKVFPYQILTTYLNAKNLNGTLLSGLERALNASLKSIPEYEGDTVVCLDTSGSMGALVMEQSGKTSSVATCTDVGALFSAAILEKNKDSKFIYFHDTAALHTVRSKTVFEVTKELKNLPGGGTDCSSPLRLINDNKMKVDTIIMLSDNQSWAHQTYSNGKTGMMFEWEKIKKNNPRAKMICIDLSPNTYTQAPDSKDILNIGGFSDSVFTVCNKFICGLMSPDVLVSEINKIEIPAA